METIMSFPSREDAAIAAAEATEDAVTTVPVTVTIETDDGSPPSVMFYAVCPHLVEWGPGIENIIADCFEMISTFLTGRRSTEA
jgi:hypothetical protein